MEIRAFAIIVGYGLQQFVEIHVRKSNFIYVFVLASLNQRQPEIHGFILVQDAVPVHPSPIDVSVIIPYHKNVSAIDQLPISDVGNKIRLIAC